MNRNELLKYQPIKILRSKKYGNNYWTPRGNKVGKRIVSLYSDLEYDHWAMVDADPEVITYCEQPLEISYVLNGRLRTSIFDMWILKKDGSEIFVEVKYEKELTSKHPKHARTQRQIEAQKEWCRINNKHYVVRTEGDIRKGRHSVENRTSLCMSVVNNKKPLYLNEVIGIIPPEGIMIKEVVKELSNLSIESTLLSLKWLLYEGNIKANMEDQIIGFDMEVWRS
ncbi:MULTISPECIES: TnsA endonuclease N-terminal domain-containing protein [Paenibacillus]|uniref:Tn7 transposase TnsA N-terminal domain-containing protein n=1 Tax=Paenibacillus vandeheii TaxID=3035917 RepID=A0ABT8JJS5_9BACL|nr:MULTISPECIES: TnsA endonuclease N-terminal domain-containing protein [Paenibacillus]MDN4605406.1 Tn7 transposase TnsA N-terminal domain-containing protein [Paenibacillus vandeheii]